MPTLNKKIEEEIVLSTPPKEKTPTPSQKEQDIVEGVFNVFSMTMQERNSGFEYFDGRNITEYIDDSVKRFTTNIDRRPGIEDWQARIHDPFTRNKVLAILGKVVDALPVVNFVARGAEDIQKAEILNTLFEYADQIDDSEEFFTFMVEEALVKGTSIGYEGLVTKEKKVRKITKWGNDNKISSTETKIINRRLISQIVPLEEFYPSNVGIRKIKDMPYCFWRKTIPHKKFLQDFSSYEKAKVVQPYSGSTIEGEKPFYVDYISPSITEGEVEILRYYNQDTDEYIITANGVWLNPLEEEQVSPIPFNHKRLPFWSIKYDIFGDFFYGKSLPDRLKSLQDVLNVLHNMLLDQSFLTIFPPILVAGMDDIEDDFMRPGRRIEVDTQGLPIDQAYKTLDLQTPTGWHQFIIEYTKKILEESSIDQVTQGIAGVGERTTATEIRSAAAGVISLLGLFAKFVKFGAKERARLRASNILQFYLSTPIIEQVMGEGASKEASKAFNIFEVESSPMSPGERGTKIIEVFKEKAQLPTKREQKLRAAIEEKTSGKKITRIAITPQYLRNFEYDVILTANTKSPQSEDMERALEIQFQQTILSLHGDLVDRKELAAELIHKFGKDPSKILKEDVLAPPVQPQQGNKQTLVPGGGDNAANTVRGGTSVGNEGLMTRDLSKQMQG